MPDAGIHQSAIFLGTAIGAITTTGSLVAWGKLDGRLDSSALNLPGKNAINIACAAANLPLFASYMSAGSSSGIGILSCTSALWGFMGWHMTSSIGGADMPVVITVLNSYSGWALAAEGFLLDNALMTSVGSLIGFSGGILTYIMCEAMNRDIANVILGGYEPQPRVRGVRFSFLIHFLRGLTRITYTTHSSLVIKYSNLTKILNSRLALEHRYR